MRNRRRRKSADPGQNLDSFLDVMTNTVGCLMFISVFVGLISGKGDAVIKTPLVSESKKVPRFFEIRENKITYVDDEKVGQAMDEVVGNLPSCNKPELELDSNLANSQLYLSEMNAYKSCIQSRANRLVNFQTETDYYLVSMTNASTFSMRYDPLPNKLGETPDEFKLADSELNQVLAKLDPKKDYLAFIVRPDSFSAFRTVREQAWKQGFEVGWEPHKSELPITFGSGGRSIGVQ